MDGTLINFLNALVSNNDILPVRVSKENLRRGKKNVPGQCAGALAICEALGCADMAGMKIQVGHKTKPHLSNRVVIKIAEAPDTKWIGWILISTGSSGFHPKRYDERKQKSPGAMMIERWSKESVLKMTEYTKSNLHTAAARKQHEVYLSTTPTNGDYRAW